MAYDQFAESIRLITEGLPQVLPPRLSRRRRFAPLAFDVDGRAAATLFVRRGVSGEPWIEEWTLERRGDGWHRLGGGAGNVGYNPLAPRPPAAQLGGCVVRAGSGWVRRKVPWYSLRARGISYARVRVSAEVEKLRVRDRWISVPEHGHQVVVWATHGAPRVEAWSSGGERLAVVDLGSRIGPGAGHDHAAWATGFFSYAADALRALRDGTPASFAPASAPPPVAPFASARAASAASAAAVSQPPPACWYPAAPYVCPTKGHEFGEGYSRRRCFRGGPVAKHVRPNEIVDSRLPPRQPEELSDAVHCVEVVEEGCRREDEETGVITHTVVDQLDAPPKDGGCIWAEGERPVTCVSLSA